MKTISGAILVVASSLFAIAASIGSSAGGLFGLACLISGVMGFVMISTGEFSRKSDDHHREG